MVFNLSNYMVFKMAAKKRKVKKKVAKKVNPLAALKTKLAELKVQTKTVKAEAKETAKRADVLVKGMVGSAPAAKGGVKKKVKKRKKTVAKK